MTSSGPSAGSPGLSLVLPEHLVPSSEPANLLPGHVVPLSERLIRTDGRLMLLPEAELVHGSD